ncbi:MFS transporter [[Haemophilus] ducreyi]|uniref:MFS transporter n=2 Tax=Haemophilus ducreyi TaxID=730 RepID=Q7VL46_HAEDU|nr:MFS transporter [[Haemophilus] ducreyi]AAP96413.1 hypothetical protein HD_1639 [[Haemophilus] ducreyi 35000HP]AKO31291.1 major facilitator transporter [[Haemophilus] ducreyi]AKO32739.1 major facilitator transporter [[Haemophilus] ducreyi]AKO34188.1 major facilitator transporter [[Haemophilus] ducreyi]AKO35631.1 major facilitator transporter [[Haemophilus] ducreyi]
MTLTNQEINQKTGISMLFILIFAYIMFAASWVGGSTLGHEILDTYFDGHVSSVMGQVINYTITIARIFANFLAASFLLRLGVRKAAILALGLLSFAMVAVWMPNYWLYTAARMIMALGGSMIMVYMNPIMAKFVAPHRKLAYNALVTASYNIGAFLVAVMFALWSDALRADWRVTLSVLAGLAIIAGLLWLWKAKDFDTKNNSETEDSYDYKAALCDPFVWKIAMGFGGFLFLYVMSLTTMPSILPKHVPNMDSSVMLLSISGGGILGTLIMLRMRLIFPVRPVLISAGIGMITTMGAAFLFAKDSAIFAYALMFISGCIMFIQYPILLNLPHELPNSSPQRVTIMISLIWAFAYAFYTLFNLIWSLVLDLMTWEHSMQFYFAIASLYLVAIMLLPENRKKH